MNVHTIECMFNRLRVEVCQHKTMNGYAKVDRIRNNNNEIKALKC